MINILSCLGMTQQSEVCLWSMLGLITTIFDATLFKVNANLKQVWQMTMPDEITLPVQRVLRTMISGVMLVQCFTVYVYLATYVVLLYPVFLEERPTLVLPWLLLAAIRKLLCELTSLALGLGTCVLVGAARPPCIRFVIIKILSIMPSFYMWMLIFNYYHELKMIFAFKSFATATTSSDHDLGLELAVRRRRTKSLFDEEALRRSLVENLYINSKMECGNFISRTQAKDTSAENLNDIDSIPYTFLAPLASASNKTCSDTKLSEEWIKTDIALPRFSDRVMEQIVLMLLQVGAYKEKTGVHPNELTNMPDSSATCNSLDRGCARLAGVDADTSPQVDNRDHSSAGAAYITEFPKIFMKQNSISLPGPTRELNSTQTQIESDDKGNMKLMHRSVTEFPEKTVSIEIESSIQRRKYYRQANNKKDGRGSKNMSTHSNVLKHEAQTVKIHGNSTTDTLENVYTNSESIVSTSATTRAETTENMTDKNKLRTNQFKTISEETTERTESKVHFSEKVGISTKVETESSLDHSESKAYSK